MRNIKYINTNIKYKSLDLWMQNLFASPLCAGGDLLHSTRHAGTKLEDEKKLNKNEFEILFEMLACQLIGNCYLKIDECSNRPLKQAESELSQ